MWNNEAARKPAAAGFLVSISFVLLLFLLSIILKGCTFSPRAQQKPHAYSDNKAARDNLPQKNEVIENPVKPGVTLEGINVGGKGRNEVEELVYDLAEDIYREAKNAEINPENWEVSDSEEGMKADITKTVNEVMQAAEGSSLKLAVEAVRPGYSQKELQDGILLISQFSTTLIDKSPGRVKNIKIAASHINCYIVDPGKEFSFNRTVGKTTAGEGYQKAIIIGKDNKREYEIGGGICQLSTTLYNTAVKAGLRITERHSHTTKVPYIAQGKDAMVNDGSADMRFINTREYPVMIRTEISSSYVKVWLLENRNKAGNER